MSRPVDDVTVVMVTWNSARYIDAAIRSLAEGLSGVERWSIVVADNDSADDTVSLVVTARTDARIVRTGGNLGYAAGLNAGVAALPDSKNYLFMNPDVRLSPGCVSTLLGAMNRSGSGITVPRLVDEQGTLHPSLRREPTVTRAVGEAVLGGRRAGRYPRLGELVTDHTVYRSRATADWASGAVMLVSGAALRVVGPWDETFFLYSEETEFALRVRDAGMSLTYCPDAEAVHIGGDVHVSPDLYSLLTRNKVRLYARRHGPVRSAAYLGAVTANELLRARRPVHRAALKSLLTSGRAALADRPSIATSGRAL